MKVERIPWILIVLSTLLLGFLMQPWVQMLTSMNTFYNLGIIVCSLGLTTSSFIVLLILWLSMKLGSVRKRVTAIHLVSLYVVGSSAGWYGVWWSSGQTFWDWPNTLIRYQEIFKTNIPWFLSPPSEALQQVLVGGVPVPWGAWLPTIAFWWAWFFFNGFFFVTLATILRRDWIEVERVPFAQAMAASEIISMMPLEGSGSIKSKARSKPFWIGVVLGILFNLPIFFTYLFPWFPDIYAWRTNTCGHGAITTPPSPIWDLIGITMIDKHPLAVAIMYLAPLQVLFSYWVWYLVYLGLMQVAYIMGYYTGIMEDPTGCCRTWGSVNVRFNEPFKWEAFSRGGMIGLTVFFLIMKRTYFTETIRAALGRPSEGTKGEPISYRTSYGLFLLSFILLTALMLVCGFSLPAAILMPITAFLFWIANARVWGATGTYIQSAEGGTALYRLFLWPSAPQPPTGEFIMASTWSGWHVNTPVEGNAGSFLSSFCSYRLADLNGVSSKSVFKMLLTVQAILPIPFMIGALWVNYTFGGSRLSYQPLAYSAPIDRFATPSNWDRIPGTEPWVPIFLAGFLAVGAVAVMHAKLIWFPFEPIGFLMAFSDASLFFGMWLPALVAWVLKTITLRVGGSRLYENYGLPFVGGFVAGFVAIAFIGGFAGIYRFFKPF